MSLNIHNALFLSWRWVWTLASGKWSTGGCRIPPLTYLRMHSCRSTPSCIETRTHDSSTPPSTDHWCRGGHAPRLSHRTPTPSSFSHSRHPISPHFSPSHSLHNHSRRKYSFFVSSRLDYCFCFCLVHVPPSFLRESLISSEPAQTETGRHRVENAVFICPILFFALVPASTTDFHSHFFFTQTCFATCISWRL